MNDGNDWRAVLRVSGKRRCVLPGDGDAQPMPGLEFHRCGVQRQIHLDLLAGRQWPGVGAKVASLWPEVFVGQLGSVRQAVDQAQDSFGQIGDSPIGCHVFEVDV